MSTEKVLEGLQKVVAACGPRNRWYLIAEKDVQEFNKLAEAATKELDSNDYNKWDAIDAFDDKFSHLRIDKLRTTVNLYAELK